MAIWASHSRFIRTPRAAMVSRPWRSMSTSPSVLPRKAWLRMTVASVLRPKLALPAPMTTILAIGMVLLPLSVP